MKAFEKARQEWLAQNADGAEKNLKKAGPDISRIRSGMVAARQNCRSRLIRRLREILFPRPWRLTRKFVLPYEQLAALAAQGEKWQETVDTHEPCPGT